MKSNLCIPVSAPATVEGGGNRGIGREGCPVWGDWDPLVSLGRTAADKSKLMGLVELISLVCRQWSKAKKKNTWSYAQR